MTQTNFLEQLEPEMQRQILLEAETPSHIHSLIRASPRLYQVFLHNKDFVLSTVARRQFHPAALSDALTFAKASQLKQPVSRQDALKFCRIESSEQTLWRDTMSSPAEVTALCRLAGNIRFIMQDYARYTLPIMEQLGRSHRLEVWPDYYPKASTSSTRFSRSEQGRLERAFCRFEIYRYIFARCSTSLDHEIGVCPSAPSINPSEQAKMYLEQFPDFQITEILCVRDYLHRRLRGICTKMESEAVDTMSPETFVFDPEGDDSNEWESGLHVFTENCKRSQITHFEHLMTLGLPYIRQLLEAAGERKRELFVNHCPGAVIRHFETRFLSEAIEHLGGNPTLEHASSLPGTGPLNPYQIDLPFNPDIPDAWLWAHPRAPPRTLKDNANKGLRDWGYVFWDYDRLQASGILKHDSDDVRRIRFDERNAGRGPSVQKRLLDAQRSNEVYEFFRGLFKEEEGEMKDRSNI